MSDVLHLVKIPLRRDKLAQLARSRGLPLRDLDDGYLCHCVLGELWQAQAPAPFVLRDRGRKVEIWGYSAADASTLIDHAQAFGDPALVASIENVDQIASKPMPVFPPGRRVGFHLRACPVVRLARGTQSHRPGAEVDAFVARCSADGVDAVSREAVYREWLAGRLNRPEKTGASADAIRVAGMSSERLVRRTQGIERKARVLQRPDVRFEGDLIVEDGASFNRWLAHGVGRHRGFGFGAVILVPPGTRHPA